MKANLVDILKDIPDFEDFMKLADEIGELSFRKMQIDNEIKAKEANIVKEALSNPIFFVGGKPPSVTYVENVYKYTGFDGELLPKREALADVSAQLDKKKLHLSIYRDMLEVFRTVSANERSVAI